MTPTEHASLWYGEHFSEVVADHFLTGYVFAGPDFFLMGKAEGEAWFVTYFAGNLARALDLIPYPLPFVDFQRDNGKPRRYSLESLTRRLRHGIETFRPEQATTAGGKAATPAFAAAACGVSEADGNADAYSSAPGSSSASSALSDLGGRD